MKKTPFVTRDQLEAICQQYPTPFHLYDEKGIRETARAVNQAFSWNKGFREYFAVKATPTPQILKILHEEGCGTDCSSLTELMMSERCGIQGHEIMFSANETPAQEYVKAAELGAIINLDDITHVDFLKETIGYIPETISCRFNPGGVFQLGESKEGFQVMDNPGDAKYGMTRPQLFEAYKRLKEMGAKTFGIHAFLASNTISNDYYPALAGQLFELAVELQKETGAHIGFINLSGGVGIDYRPEQPKNDIAVIGEGVRRKFEEILVPAGMGDVAIFTEMGRFMLAPNGHLVTRAIHEKHTYKEYIGVDACAANLMRPAIYGAYHHVTVMGKEEAPCDHLYDVVGSLCENCDKFAVDRMLPQIDKGDLLVIHDTGAHGFSMGYNYNGRLRSAEILLQEDGETRMMRRAETPEDYFATLIWEK
ncbi:MAG: diaminopimelate decarboxylase [Oscillospiraceae bacterium]|nr:diaminopimelate decarboxylase [Oscillospiraceae bacterium]